MDIKLFQYDEEKHLGNYKGKPIPSVTQLVDIIYPLDSSIPEDRLESASKRGTEIHDFVEVYNNFATFKDDFPAYKFARDNPHQEIGNYRRLLLVYKLQPVNFEERVFLLDENEEPICFGHYDLIVKASEHSQAFNKGEKYLTDIKTTSEFNRAKTSLQTQLYRLALSQQGVKLNPKTYGLHLRSNDKEDKHLLIPLVEFEDSELLKLAKELRRKWDGE